MKKRLKMRYEIEEVLGFSPTEKPQSRADGAYKIGERGELGAPKLGLHLQQTKTKSRRAFRLNFREKRMRPGWTAPRIDTPAPARRAN